MGSTESVVGVAISEIDPELRPASEMRVSLDEEAIEEYRKSIDDMPPVKLLYDDETKKHWVVDGAHTITAAKRNGLSEVRALVGKGNRLRAFQGASRANTKNGVRITNADKRHRVEIALNDPKMSTWSQGRIAEWCAVTQQYVSKLDYRSTHNSCESDSYAPKTVGRDGKARKAPERSETPDRSAKSTLAPMPTITPGAEPPTHQSRSDAAWEVAEKVAARLGRKFAKGAGFTIGLIASKSGDPPGVAEAIGGYFDGDMLDSLASILTACAETAVVPAWAAKLADRDPDEAIEDACRRVRTAVESAPAHRRVAIALSLGCMADTIAYWDGFHKRLNRSVSCDDGVGSPAVVATA